MNDAALLLDVSSLSTTRRAIRSMSSARRVGVVAGLALATMLPVTAPAAAQEQEPVAARIARENLPSVVTLIVPFPSALSEDRYVQTASVGFGDQRKVVIRPRDGHSDPSRSDPGPYDRR